MDYELDRRIRLVTEPEFKNLYSWAHYSCINKTCAGPRTACLIYCAEGKCVGGMPNKPASGLTLIGILQNGTNVNRGGAAEEPVSGDDSGSGSAAPECNGGCGPIF